MFVHFQAISASLCGDTVLTPRCCRLFLRCGISVESDFRWPSFRLTPHTSSPFRCIDLTWWNGVDLQCFLSKVVIYAQCCISSYQLSMGTCHLFLLTGKAENEKEPSRSHWKRQVLTCHYQLHGEVLIQAIFCIAQDDGVVSSMLWSHISYAQSVLHWVRLIASVVILDQFAVFVPVLKVPSRLIMCMHAC